MSFGNDPNTPRCQWKFRTRTVGIAHLLFVSYRSVYLHHRSLLIILNFQSPARYFPGICLSYIYAELEIAKGPSCWTVSSDALITRHVLTRDPRLPKNSIGCEEKLRHPLNILVRGPSKALRILEACMARWPESGYDICTRCHLHLETLLKAVGDHCPTSRHLQLIKCSVRRYILLCDYKLILTKKFPGI